MCAGPCINFWALGDEKFDVAELKQMYSAYESLFWCKVKTPWPISARDMSATSLREISEDECYVVMTSVEDESVPLVSGNVRANLFISGWKIVKQDVGIAITYITQVDLAGSIPSSFVKNIQQQVPLCAGEVVKYAQDYGFPPSTTTCTAVFKLDNWDHSKREYTVTLEGEGEGSWLISKKMYFNGINVAIEGNATHEIVQLENGNSIVKVNGISGLNVVKITKA